MLVKKRLFVGLLTGCLALAALLLAGAWTLFSHQAAVAARLAVGLLGGGVLLWLAVVAMGVLGLVVSLWRVRPLPRLQRLMLWAVNLLFPVAVALGRIFRIDRDTIRGSFVAVNNQLVRGRRLVMNPQELLILAPQCLQRSKCSHKITVDVRNCRQCGQCPITDLRRLADSYGVRLAVATGGTLARKLVQDYRPRALVAIACERDLTSGIQDTRRLPVLGVLNIRPEGPCFNTRVNLPQVEEAVRFFLAGCRQADNIQLAWPEGTP